MKIVKNQVKCKHCGRRMRSYTIAGYIECDCGKVGITGGQHELKRYGNEEDYVEESVIETSGKKV